MKEFLKHFQSDNSKIEFTKIKDWIISVITEKEALENKEANIYFLWWVKKDLVYSNWIRAKDNDIIEKNYFCLDLDIAKNFEEEYNEKISYEDIEKEAINIIENLKYEDEYFAEFSFIIISWWWLHIYYTWDFKQFTKEEYSLWVNRIYKQWNKIMWSKIYEVDFACKNIARILRLPWSINQKYWKECKILFAEKKDSKLFNLIKSFAVKEQEELENYKLAREKEIQDKLKIFNKSENNFYDEINSIPAYQIAELLIPEFPFDWKKNFKNNKWWFTWYYYVSETNTICNGWSRYFLFTWDESSCWNNFSLVKNFKSLSDKQCFLLFKEILCKK